MNRHYHHMKSADSRSLAYALHRFSEEGRGVGTLLIVLNLLVLALLGTPVGACEVQGHGAAQGAVLSPMPQPGKKVVLKNGSYLVYRFDRKPKIGTVIMKIEAYNARGERDTSLEILADSGMPSMGGAHETGDQPFRLSRKGDYLLPLNIVMPGEWEVRLCVRMKGETIFRGSHRFTV